MQFTPQQLAGGPKYSRTARVGNWLEDIALEDAKVDDFLGRSKGGTLHVKKMRDKITKCTQSVPHTYSEDGYIRFGDYIVIEHDNTGSTLACDPFNELSVGSERFHMSSSRDSTQCARNTFRILRPSKALKNPEDDLEDPLLHVGQAFCLGCNEILLTSDKTNLLAPQLYVCSTFKNDRNSTKATNKQLTFLSPYANADSIWIIMPPSHGTIKSNERILAIGEPMKLEDAYVMLHRSTNTVLTVNPGNKELTDFGPAYECYTDYQHTTGQLSLMEREAKGMCTSTSLVKADVPFNLWHFVGARDSLAATDSRMLPPVANTETILDDLYRYARTQGTDGFVNLRFRLQDLDRRSGGDGMLDKEDVKSALTRWGCGVESRYMDMILDDVTKKGTLVDYKEFFKRLRGPINPARKPFIESVFESLDKDGLDAIPFGQMTSRFNAALHPLLKVGYTDKQLHDQLKLYFSSRGRPVIAVTYGDFEEYFADLSAVIDDDSYFREFATALFPSL